MKKEILILFLVLGSFNCFSQEEIEEEFEHHCNFKERSLTVGLGVPYSFSLEAPGVNLRMYYNMGEHICFGPEYSFVKYEDVEVVDFDLVGHYIFETPWMGIYPLIGANYTIETEDHHEKEITASLGVVFGAGVHRNFNGLTIFAEYSRVEWGINDQFITTGLMFNFQ